MMEEFTFFHDFTLIVISFITMFVLYVILKTMTNKFSSLNLMEGQMIECVWTLLPAMVLIQVAVPSLMLLYMLDEAFSGKISLKVIGHQWFWSYEYSDFWGQNSKLEFDSYMLRDDSSMESCFHKNGLIRLLDVDNRTTLPYSTPIRLMVSSSDVLHAWTVPSLGVKVDASPGRLNQLNFLSYRPGVYYGQCSEICGANHSFMPISVEFISPSDYLWWAYS